jgi:hypothetical protein
VGPNTKPSAQRRAGVTALCAVGVSMFLASCTTDAGSLTNGKQALTAAGFVARPANTAAREAMLKRLPQGTFLKRAHGAAVNYIYADKKSCNCLYIGTPEAYRSYLRAQRQRNADQSSTAVQTYADADWDWSRWGSDIENFYGPFGSGERWSTY